MNLQFTQEELDFQKEVRDWIKENYPEDMKAVSYTHLRAHETS